MMNKLKRKKRPLVVWPWQKRRFSLLVLWSKMSKKYFKRVQKNGFTMIELLIIVVIVASASTAGVVGFQASQQKARDAQRKGDLEKIKVAFEDYYNDNLCYPPERTLDACGSASFQPYLPTIPCDPMEDTPYLYVPLENTCAGYRLHTSLENSDDQDIEDLNCDGDTGCGYGLAYNYGVSAGVPVYDPTGQPLVPSGSPASSPASSPAPSAPSSPVPSPTGPVYVYACDNSGTCNQFEEGHPTLLTCPVTFPQSNCNNECDNPVFHCGN